MTPADGGFTAAQAERGKLAYDNGCAACHDPSMRGFANEFGAPALAGQFFTQKWAGHAWSEVHSYASFNMPPGGPRIPAQDMLDVFAYILQVNGLQPGTTELTAESAVLASAIPGTP